MIFDNPENLTRVTELITVADDYTGGYLGAILLIVFSFGTFLLTSQFSTKESFVATSFVMLSLSLLLKFFFGLIGDIWVYGSVVFFIGAVAFSFASRENSGA